VCHRCCGVDADVLTYTLTLMQSCARAPVVHPCTRTCLPGRPKADL
jgi:hypothetical protein